MYVYLYEVLYCFFFVAPLSLLFDAALSGHDVAESVDGHVGALDALECAVVLVVLDHVLKVANDGREEVGHVESLRAIEWFAQSEM